MLSKRKAKQPNDNQNILNNKTARSTLLSNDGYTTRIFYQAALMESVALPEDDEESLADNVFAIETTESLFEAPSTARLVRGRETLCDSQGNAILRVKE